MVNIVTATAPILMWTLRPLRSEVLTGTATGPRNPTQMCRRHKTHKEGTHMAKILIVDDSPSDIRFMTEALKGSAHECVSITDSQQTEATVEAERPQLALLDVVMPERNGYETLRALKKLPAAEGMKVIFVSSKGAETDVKWGMRQGAVDYLIKPYTPEQLLSLIARHV